MFKNLVKAFDGYTPTLLKSWILVLIFCSGSLLGVPFLKTPLGDINSFNYILPFIPLFLYIYISGRRMPESEHYPINQPKFSLASNLWIFPLLLILVIAVAIVIDPIAALIPMPEQIKALFRESFGKNVNIIDLVISTTILAPIMEETLCRGIILRGISRYNGALSAVVWSAFIFALIHLNPWQAIPAFILGLIFGWVYIKTRSIWLVVFMHFVNNGFFVVLTRSLPNIDVDSIIADFMPMWLYLVLWAVSIVTTAVILIFLNKKINSYEQETLSSKISTSC